MAHENPARLLTEMSVNAAQLDPTRDSDGKPSAARPRAAHTSYHLSRWRPANRLLAIADVITLGHADWVQRLATYLVFGGTSALVNLVVFMLILRLRVPTSDVIHNLIAYLVAAEASIMVNFLLNDAVTFRHLPGHNRQWPVRCARFHATCIVGTVFAYVVQLALHFAFGMPALVAEALAIALLTAFNFASHHIFTYRRQKPSGARVLR
jgi:putative flippase GtrA